jgi:hypothetical protein
MHEENCPCQDDDYEWYVASRLLLTTLLTIRRCIADSDYNYVNHNGQCVPVGPEPIPAGVCKDPDQVYKGSSGYRLIPGNTCDRKKGVKKDKPVEKKCSQGESYLTPSFLDRHSGATTPSPTRGGQRHSPSCEHLSYHRANGRY